MKLLCTYGVSIDKVRIFVFMSLKKLVGIVSIFLTTAALGQGEVSQHVAQESSASQKAILVVMTVIGVTFVGLGLRKSKLFRKK